MGPVPLILYIAYMAIMQFAVLNILTGVFCQSALDSAAHDQEMMAQSMAEQKHMYIRNMRQLFKDIDDDGSGSLSVAEFMAHLHDEGVRLYFESLDIDTSDVGTLFRLLDQDAQNELDVEEFVAGCLRIKGAAKGIDIAKLTYAQGALAKRLQGFMLRTDAALEQLTRCVARGSPKGLEARQDIRPLHQL
mmetsp:Transcript_98042/g.272808  ORF Transcript_98042/g.272808 Transcript_98042/m.272808 type:complete len:190 (-) Transcript_98042:233-802(-)